MAMGGHARNRIVEREEVANHWIDTLRRCDSSWSARSQSSVSSSS
jgi:hypothetical protein